MRTTALPRAAVAPLLAAALGLAALASPAPSASASPTPPPVRAVVEDPPMGPPVGGEAETGDSAQPVRIDVGRFEPRTITPGALVTVTGTLTNTGPSVITDLTIRLQRGAVLTTRADLAADQRHPDPAATVLAPFRSLPGGLAPGNELPFGYTVPAADLQLTRDGVYPVLINVNGAVDGLGQRRVGELSSYVVQQPAAPPVRTAVAWLWPIAEPSHRTASGAFRDDGLADSVSSGGRLDRALSVIERLPGGLAGESTEAAPAVAQVPRVALAIDPALVEELRLMAAGPYDAGGQPGRGTEAAAAYLKRLADVAAVHPVVALPYGDVDADALTAAGLPDVLTRSLPGTPEGTAQDPPGSSRSGDAAAAGSDGATSPSAPQTAGAARSAGAAILSDALGVEPRTDLLWAAGGSLRPETVPVLRAGGVAQVVLGAAGLTEGDDATGYTDATAAARSTVPTAGGPLDVLVADTTLGRVVGSAEQATGGARMAEQRYLAELAVLSLQARGSSEQTVLIAPPREVDAGPEGAGAMMADTASLPWLRPATLAELSTGAASPAGDLADPRGVPTLDPAGMVDVAAAVAVREDLAGAVVGDEDAALRSYDAAVSRAVSATRRDDPEQFRQVAAALRTMLDRGLDRVTLLAPADGTYSLGSSDAPLVLTVRNDLPMTVEVRLDVRTRGSRGLVVGDIGVQTLAPGQRSTLQVPTEVRQSGGFAVRARLTTPGGRPLGDEISLQVRSTVYGSISLIITVGAAALLGLLFLRRLVAFVLRRRLSTADAAAAGRDNATRQPPPDRSPV